MRFYFVFVLKVLLFEEACVFYYKHYFVSMNIKFSHRLEMNLFLRRAGNEGGGVELCRERIIYYLNRRRLCL